MLLSAVSVLVVAQSSSKIPEGLINNPVLLIIENIMRMSHLKSVLYNQNSKGVWRSTCKVYLERTKSGAVSVECRRHNREP